MDLNPFSYEFHEDPHPTYRWLRRHAPLHRNEALGFYTLARYADVRAASLDWGTYSSAEGTTVERLDTTVFAERPMMIFMDPPRHGRLRALVSRVFTAKRVADLEPFVRATAVRLLEPLTAACGGDFVRQFSAPLPMEVIFTLLGVPDVDRRQLRTWMDRSLERDRDTPAIPPRAIEAMMSLMGYWSEFLSDLRQHPNSGLIAGLLDATVDGERLTDGEIIGFCSLLGAAGNETVTKLLGAACVLLARAPEQWADLVTDPGLIPSAVEEALRYASPSQYQGRTVMRDVEWYGTRVPAGARVLLLTGSANRDEQVFSEPDRFDIRRQPNEHLALGIGVHFCLGAALARLEARVALEEFGRRFPHYAVDESRCVRVHMSNVHGFESVPFGVAGG
jgi:cytochrome P450